VGQDERLEQIEMTLFLSSNNTATAVTWWNALLGLEQIGRGIIIGTGVRDSIYRYFWAFLLLFTEGCAWVIQKDREKRWVNS